MSTQEKKSYILHELKRYGCRVISQRQTLIDIILQGECCTYKEIYYRAVKSNSAMRITTAYRVVWIPEGAELIKRKNLYQAQYGERSA